MGESITTDGTQEGATVENVIRMLDNAVKEKLPRSMSEATTHEQLLSIIPNEPLRDVVREFATKTPVVASGYPEWALSAAREAWKAAKIIPDKSEAYTYGYVIGVVRRCPQEAFADSNEIADIVNFLGCPELLLLACAAATKEPVEVAADFFQGLADALRNPVEFQPISKFWIYVTIAFYWREVQALRNTSALCAWLQGKLNPNLVGDKDRVTKLRQGIGLSFTDRGGRPTAKTLEKPPTAPS